MLAGLRAAGLKSQCVQEDATEGVRGGDNVLPVGAWYCSDVSDAEECKQIAIDANNWRFAA
jgi:hypothetical protein